MIKKDFIVHKSMRFLIAWTILMGSFSVMHATTVGEVFMILSRYAHNPAQVGEVAPLSQAAGLQLARFIGQGNVGKKYLEAGGGCGAVSICIAQALRPEDRLDVIEIDPEMCALLTKRLQGFGNVRVHCCSILEWDPGFKYDAIISTLPFNSLGIEFTKRAMHYFQRMAAQGCVVSYVEYPMVKQALQYFYMGERKRNFQEVQQYLEPIRQQYLQEQTMIYFNVPPIAIYHLCFDKK